MNSKRSPINLAACWVLSVMLPLTGCVAVWGEAHNVVTANENEFKIQYDSSATSSARAAAMARENCKKYGKIAEPVSAEMPGLLIGIIEETYSCVSPAKTSAG